MLINYRAISQALLNTYPQAYQNVNLDSLADLVGSFARSNPSTLIRELDYLHSQVQGVYRQEGERRARIIAATDNKGMAIGEASNPSRDIDEDTMFEAPSNISEGSIDNDIGDYFSKDLDEQSTYSLPKFAIPNMPTNEELVGWNRARSENEAAATQDIVNKLIKKHPRFRGYLESSRFEQADESFVPIFPSTVTPINAARPQQMIPGIVDAVKEASVNNPASMRGFGEGFRRGKEFSVNDPYTIKSNSATSFDAAKSAERHHPRYGKGVITDRADELDYADLDPLGRAGFTAGRFVGDVTNNGTRHWMWNIFPAEIAYNQGYRRVIEDPKGLGTSTAGVVLAGTAGFLTAEGLGIASGNYNPTNLAQGMRPQGYGAITPDEEDPRISTTPVVDTFARHVLGRRGRILPWEEFTLERPDVSYDEYQKYRNWQSGKEPDPLSQATLGLAKFNPDGIQGQPEAQFMGYNMTPVGVGVAAGTIASAALLNRHLAAQALKNL